MFSRKTKSILLYITFGILLYALLMNFGSVLSFLKALWELLVPVLFGLLFAFVLNVPMEALERRMKKWWPNFTRRIGWRWLHAISLILTLLLIFVLFGIAIGLAVPALVDSVQSIGPLLEEKQPEIFSLLSSLGIDTTGLRSWFESIDLESLSSFDHLFTKTYNLVSGFFSTAVSAVIGLIIAIYILLSRDRLSEQVLSLLYAVLPVRAADTVDDIFCLLSWTYSKFLSGQCVEACILGMMMFISYSLFSLPYAALTAFLTALCAFIPYIGAFTSLAISAFLVFLVSPSEVLLCIVVYSVTQFIENQFVYPHVVGSSVGLSPLFTLLAALLGGKFFGLFGIIFCIPLAAALGQILHHWIEERLREKNIPRFQTHRKAAAEPPEEKADPA